MRYIIPCSNTISSAIKVKSIIKYFQTKKQALGFNDGPAISDLKRNIYSLSDTNGLQIIMLEGLFKEWTALFPQEITTILEIRERYYSHSTWRRTADTRTIEMNVSDKDKNMVIF